jgi:tRNA threonylcarbamoyladenosine biosynthesis protein TsaB
MLILALDTTHASGSLVLAREGEIMEARAIESPDGFGHTIYQEIEALLDRHGVRLAEIDVYGAASGPGSFTGIRVGLSVVKALAEVHGKKVVPVSNLAAMASAAEGRYRAPVMDARREQVYAAVYDEALQPVVLEIATPWQDFLALVGPREVTFVSTDPSLFEPSGIAPLPSQDGGPWRRVTVSPLLAGPIALLAAARHQQGVSLPPETVDANYVRRADAELNWKDRV